MTMNERLLIELNRIWNYRQIIGDPATVSMNLRHNAISSVILTVDKPRKHSSAKVDELRQPDCRVRITMRDKVVFTGVVTQRIETPDVITVKFESHFRTLFSTVTKPGENQTGSARIGDDDPQGIYRTKYTTGNLTFSGEAVAAFNYAAKNCWYPRFRTSGPDGTYPVPSWPDTQTSFSVRLKPLSDLVPLLLDPFDIGVCVVPEDYWWPMKTHLVYYRGQTLGRTLTDRSGMVTDWEATYTPKSVSGAVVAGQGEGADRQFVYNYGGVGTGDFKNLWKFVDARDAADEATLIKRSKEAIAEGVEKVGLTATLAEGRGFQFIKDFWLGDRISFSLADDTLKMTERVNEVQVDWTRDQGLVVTPKVGDITDSPEAKYVQAIRNIGRRTTNLETR